MELGPATRRSAGALGETVLIVDDDRSIVSISREILTRLGYYLLHASSTERAREVASQYPHAIDLLITDVLLPDGTGPELARSLRQARPKLAVLLMSGHTRETLPASAGAIDSLPLLQKPFSIASLHRMVRDTIAEMRRA